MTKSIVMLKDVSPNRYCIAKDTLLMKQNLSESNKMLLIIINAITIAPIRLPEILRQTIMRLEVFFIDCFVMKKDSIKKTLSVMITGQ